MIDLERLTLPELQGLSEQRFRKEVFIPLLGQLQVYDVQDLQGNREFGIDVYFCWYDNFHIRRHFGVQLKVGDITLTAKRDPTTDVAEICRQLKMAFGRPILVADGGITKTVIDGYYVVTTGNISPNAREYIYEHRTEYPYINFLTGPHLLEIVEKRRSLETIHKALRTLDSSRLGDTKAP